MCDTHRSKFVYISFFYELNAFYASNILCRLHVVCMKAAFTYRFSSVSAFRLYH